MLSEIKPFEIFKCHISEAEKHDIARIRRCSDVVLFNTGKERFCIYILSTISFLSMVPSRPGSLCRGGGDSPQHQH